MIRFVSTSCLYLHLQDIIWIKGQIILSLKCKLVMIPCITLRAAASQLTTFKPWMQLTVPSENFVCIMISHDALLMAVHQVELCIFCNCTYHVQCDSVRIHDLKPVLSNGAWKTQSLGYIKAKNAGGTLSLPHEWWSFHTSKTQVA